MDAIQIWQKRKHVRAGAVKHAFGCSGKGKSDIKFAALKHSLMPFEFGRSFG